MAALEPGRPDYLEATRDLLERMPFAKELGMVLDVIEPGRVSGKLARRLEWTQQHGVLHAGVVVGLADQVAGMAAFTLLPEGADIVSVNFAVSMLRPADAPVVFAEGWVVKAGRRLIFTAARVFGERSGRLVDFATAAVTMAVKKRDSGAGTKDSIEGIGSRE